MKASFEKQNFIFKVPCVTSRDVMTTKTSWFIKIWEEMSPEIFGIGEVSVIQGLSIDNYSNIEEKISYCCQNINFFQKNYQNMLPDFPSIRFALETAFLDLKNGGQRILFPSDFTDGKKGIPINGLIWMGKPNEMKTAIKEKLNTGFRCIKLKISTANFNDVYKILEQLRKEFSAEELEIRVDANGDFTPDEAPFILEKLSRLKIHSIEQPIRANQWEEMSHLCRNTPIPIALDEELIGINEKERQKEMLSFISPSYIVLKPSLIGGFEASQQWIDIAEENNCKWWITSALESNIGLNAIAQWTATLNVNMPQGLGTGQLFENNTETKLEIKEGTLFHIS